MFILVAMTSNPSAPETAHTESKSTVSPPDPRFELWHTHGARQWEEAFPVGNGAIGAMHFGTAPVDQVQFTHEWAWTPSPTWTAPADSPERVLAARAAVLDGDGDLHRADDLLRGVQGPDSASFLPLGEVTISHEGCDAASVDRRLDLRNAVSTSTFTTPTSSYQHQVLVSQPAQVLAVLITSTRDLDVNVSLRCALPANLNQVGLNSVIASGLLARDAEEAASAGRFAVALTCRTDGTVDVDQDGLRLRGGQSALVVLAAIADPSDRDDRSTVLQSAANSADRGWAELLAEHCADVNRLLGGVGLTLPLTPASTRPTDERIEISSQKPEPALAALAFHFGRYLLASSSRTGGLPANLQGIWNHQLEPSWRSNYTLNINIPMLYWAAESTGLSACHRPLLDFIERLASNGEAVARSVYGAPGWVAHHNSDASALAWPVGATSGDPAWANWPMGGVWLCQHLWQHVTYTEDLDYLKSIAFPVMREAARFCAWWLVSVDGVLTTAPSTSPENHVLAADGRPAGAARGSSCDLALIGQLFDNVRQAAELLGEADDELHELARLRAKLARPGITPDGLVAEWQGDAIAADPEHRHLSHLVWLYPGEGQPTPELLDAARRSLTARGDEGPGWSRVWKAALWARLGDGDRAHALIRQALRPTDLEETGVDYIKGGVYPGLLSAHPPFQLDGNCGLTAAIVAMLLQCSEQTVHLLPALPSDWPDGEIQGLRAPGGVVVDAAWKRGTLTSARLRSGSGRVQHVTIVHREVRTTVILEPGDDVILDEQLRTMAPTGPRATPQKES
jgi:alpha-L-fucosidase 2